jgi:predicted GNAT family acetyltransferase
LDAELARRGYALEAPVAVETADYRRRGLARSIVSGIAHAAVGQGVKTLYLQVERENEMARAVYKKLGFAERYGYHYRSKT